tara:strand:- start:29 stop:157 length:129 start_codon:yes stop_codon:yes gene_type:complete
MKKIYLIIVIFVVLVGILSSLAFIEIPAPSKIISENFSLGIK